MQDPMLRKLQKNAEKARQMELGEVINEPFGSWPSAARAAPNALIRCALFRAARGGTLKDANGERVIHKDKRIASLGGMVMTYRGEDLDQRDLDVWMAVLELYQNQLVSEIVTVSSNELLKLMNTSNTGPNHIMLRRRLQRLNFTQIEIRSENEEASKFAFYGPLIQNAQRNESGSHWQISLAPQMRALFNDGYTWVHWNVRCRLQHSPLAQWLHSFYRSHAKPYDISVQKLRELCGSGSKELRYFRSDLKKALKRVQEACDKYEVGFYWEYLKQGDKIRVNWESDDPEKQRAPLVSRTFKSLADTRKD